MKITATLLLVFISVNCMGQSKISGIGPFKINNTTISIIDSLSRELGPFEKVNDGVKGVSMSHFEAIYNFEKTYGSPAGASACSKVRVFCLEQIIISGITFKQVDLVFYNDTLKQFMSSFGKEISEAIKTKYGEPKMDKKEKKITCINKATGNQYQEEEYSLSLTWQGNNVVAQGGYDKYFDNDCKEHYISWFEVEEKGISAKIKKCGADSEAENEKKVNEAKKKSLEDL